MQKVQELLDKRVQLLAEQKELERQRDLLDDKIYKKEDQIEEVGEKILEKRRKYPDGTSFITRDTHREVIVTDAHLYWLTSKKASIRYTLAVGRSKTKQRDETDITANLSSGKWRIKQKGEFTLGKSITFRTIVEMSDKNGFHYYYGITRKGIMIVFRANHKLSQDEMTLGSSKLVELNGGWALNRIIKTKEGRITLDYTCCVYLEKICFSKEDMVEYLL